LAKILGLCASLDQRLARGIELNRAIEQTLRAAGELPEAIVAGFKTIEQLEFMDTTFTIAISSVKSGWILDQDLVTKDGTKLLVQGHTLTGSAIVRLRSYVSQGRLEDFVQVKGGASKSKATQKSEL
jgi:hypothetical protein